MLSRIMAFREVAFALALLASLPKASAVTCLQDLLDALSYCNAPTTQTLLSSYPAQTTCQMRSGNGQPLHLVSHFFCSLPGDDCFSTLKVLLESGADPNAKHPKTGMTVSHILIEEYGRAKECKNEVLKRGLGLLISYGADPQVVDARRRSVVDLAKSKGVSQAIIDLLEGRKEQANGDDGESGAGGHADGDGAGAGGESGKIVEVVAAVAGLVVFLTLIATAVYIARKKARYKKDRASKGVVSTPVPRLASTTTQGSQEAGRAAGGPPAPMIILATYETGEP